METKLPCPLVFLLPLCRRGDGRGVLEKVGANPIFDRNVIGLVAKFAKELTPNFLRQWGSVGSDRGQFKRPFGVAVHPHMDLVFVTDTDNYRMQSFRRDGTAVKQWGAQGAADGEFNCPWGVAVLARGHPVRNLIFVSDCGLHRIQVFSVDGSFIRKWGTYGTGDGQFNCPAGVAVHPVQDLIYVVDMVNKRVQVFGPDGTFVRKWSIQSVYGPYGAAVHPTRDLIFVSEGDSIQVFRSNGTFVFKWGSKGSDNGQFYVPAHLALHAIRDLLFVTDSRNHRVQIFDLDGSFVGKCGSQGDTNGEFRFPGGISVDPIHDEVYVSDNRSVQAFSIFSKGKKM